MKNKEIKTDCWFKGKNYNTIQSTYAAIRTAGITIAGGYKCPKCNIITNKIPCK